jgi:multidrug efflux pump
LAGVGLVTITGGQKPAVRVQANPTALSSYGINLDDVRTTLQQAGVNQAKGNFDGPRQAYEINANDQLLTSKEYRSLVIAYRNGAPVVLSDVARVIDAVENSKLAAWRNDAPAVIVNIQRQPGANTIQVVDSVKRLLPQLKATLPASIDVSILTDRTTTIRASVRDVQFSLMLTVALVVMAIFLFLRNVSATIIPSVAVPLSLVGTLGVMYLLGYSLNNLTLIALTISTGFVVDDAIVMIENIVRYIEAGEKPLQAALKGAEQIGFTIISLAVSLIAVLIPLLFMGDIVGRLFREFAVTLSVTILVSAVVSLTLTPMMCSRLLRAKSDAKPGRLYDASERVYDRVIAFYGRTLQWVLKRQGATLLVAAVMLVLTVWLYIIVPKGFFPVQDTGVIQGISDAAQNISFTAMADRQRALAQVILKDPAVESLSSFIGVDGINTTLNSGRILINLRPLEERKLSASEVIRRLQPELAKVDGITLYMQPIQDLTVEDRVSRTQFQYTLEDADAAELNTWTAKLMEKLPALPQLRDVATDQQTRGSQAKLVIDRVTASRFGITPQAIDNALYDAFGQRQITTLFTQLNQYHVILETLPEFQRNLSKLQDIYVGSAAGGAVPLSAFTHFESGTAPLAINHQGQFPSVTISFNLAPGAALGEATKAIEQTQAELGMPLSIQASFQGTGPGLQSLTEERAVAHSRGHCGGVHRSRRSLRELHPSHHDSLDAALGRSRSDSCPDALPH